MTAELAQPCPESDAAALANRYGVALRQYFERRLKEPSEAEDLAQEVFLRLTTRQHALETAGTQAQTQAAYIFATARSVLTDKLRRDQARERGAHCGLENADSIETPSAERVYCGQEAVDRVLQLMQEMSPRAREVFVMHRVEGMAYSEISEALAISVSTVEKHMIAALRFLVAHAAELEV
jgi:RNA polymerase sigma-70 factor (ECF subfamily)